MKAATPARPRTTSTRSEAPAPRQQSPQNRPATIGNTALAPALEAMVETAARSGPPPGGRQCGAHGLPLHIMNLTESTCRWPVGEPGTEGFYFCGARSATGMPYCTHHARMAYQPVQDRRRDRRLANLR